MLKSWFEQHTRPEASPRARASQRRIMSRTLSFLTRRAMPMTLLAARKESWISRQRSDSRGKSGRMRRRRRSCISRTLPENPLERQSRKRQRLQQTLCAQRRIQRLLSRAAPRILLLRLPLRSRTMFRSDRHWPKKLASNRSNSRGPSARFAPAARRRPATCNLCLLGLAAVGWQPRMIPYRPTICRRVLEKLPT